MLELKEKEKNIMMLCKEYGVYEKATPKQVEMLSEMILDNVSNETLAYCICFCCEGKIAYPEILRNLQNIHDAVWDKEHLVPMQNEKIIWELCRNNGWLTADTNGVMTVPIRTAARSGREVLGLARAIWCFCDVRKISFEDVCQKIRQSGYRENKNKK